jgi:hypothetical protein
MRPNTTQRSWSNYVGDKPNQKWNGTKAYKDSPLYGPVSEEAAQEIPTTQNPLVKARDMMSPNTTEDKMGSLDRMYMKRKAKEAMSKQPMIGVIG